MLQFCKIEIANYISQIFMESYKGGPNTRHLEP